ncbi:MAG: PEP-CTERM system TPR-repeat protein PrsT [Burkholderiales bacterium]|nr:PEP-CTERM system TPR-repeat protein PrsT [Burkholderiales bacterium]
MRDLKPLLRTLRACALAAALVSLAACSYFDNPLDKARVAFEKGDLATARIEAANAIQKDENDAEAHLLLGSILDAQGDLAAAARVLRRAATLGIARARVDAVLARVLLRSGQFKAILEELNPGPDHRGETLGIVLAVRGHAQLAQGQLEQAKASLNEALVAAPDLPEALLGQAQLAYGENDPQRAMVLVESVIARFPRHGAALNMKARLLSLAGKTDDAIAVYTDAAQADPVNPAPQLAAAELLMDVGRFDEARGRIERVRNHLPNYPVGRYFEAQWHYRQQQYDQALEVLQAARRASPGFVPVVKLLAMTHLARGNPNQAEELLRTIVQTDPRNAQARRLYVITLIRQGKTKPALDAIAPALTEAPDDPAWLSLAADAHAAAREFSKAVEYMTRAARARSGDANTLTRLGMLRLAAGDTESGLRQLEQAVGENKDGIGPDFGLAAALMERHDYAKALQVARGIQQKQPNNPIGFTMVGLAQAAMNDHTAASRSFAQALRLDASYWPAAMAMAQIERAAGRPDAARKIIETFLVGEPGNVTAQYALLQLSGDRGRFMAALEAARRADAKALAPRLALANSYSAHGLGELALAVAREALAIAPQDANAQQAMGTAQLAAGRRAEALETFRRLANAQPNSGHAQVLLAQAHAALGDMGRTEAALERALAIDPQDPGAIEGLAKLYAFAGRHAEAMKLADGLKNRLPKSGIGAALAGDLWLAQKNDVAALKAYDAAFALSPSGTLLLKRHRTAIRTGRDPGAAPLAQWLERNPHDFEVRFYLGNRHYAAGRYEAAVEQFQRVIESDPQNALAHNNLASAYLKLRDSRALEAAQKAHALLPDHASILDTLGLALMRAGRTEKALEMHKMAAAREPDSAEIISHYALALAQSGDRAAGRAVLRTLLTKGAKPELDADARALLENR